MKKRARLLVRSSFLIGIFFLICASQALAEEGDLGKVRHMKLLAVQETKDGYNGSLADLYLELKEGSGRVFLETFPLTQMDTQISTRFAKDMACDYFKLECDRYDFIYTIKAKSNIIGGPSAGAAVSALTVVSLLNLDYDEQATITGTINSGGIIGPIGGLKEKLEVAAKGDLSKVLIARGSGSFKEKNKTVDLVEFARENLSLEVKEAGDLNGVLFELTGKELRKNNFSVEISPNYQELMKELSDLLCQRTKDLEKELAGFRLTKNESQPIKEKMNSSNLSLGKQDYYSAASFCFGANILIKKLTYEKKKVGPGWIKNGMEQLGKKVDLMKAKLDEEKIETLSDLQTLMVVKERLVEVKEKVSGLDKEEDKNYALAYADERFFSAISWMYFFNMEGKSFVLDQERLKESCMEKIAEGEERYQYVELIFRGFDIQYIRDKIDEATADLNQGDFDLCLARAIQAKAEANTILNALGLTEENLDSFLESKKKAVEKVIAENSAEGVFPILGYSYYEYARSLEGEDKRSTLLYLEYALEMSDLDIYFKEEAVKEESLWREMDKTDLRFIEGLGMGIGVTLAVILGTFLIRRKKKFKKIFR